MIRRRRAVYVNCDGLGRDWLSQELTPALHDIAGASVCCAAHRAVFPSVTRVSAAAIATGCTARRHGLHGNRMGLIEGGRIVVHDVGKPDFRNHLRRVTGRTLLVPTLAERTAAAGGFIGFSNVSPGAAYFLDPDHFGHVYHRAGSFAPGGAAIAGDGALNVTHDLAGDRAMTQRFCAEVLHERRPALAVLWLANPDLTLHGAPLGSPAHREALRVTEQNVLAVYDTVQQLRAGGEDILLMVGSDHGQETIGDCVDLEAWLAEQGLGALLEAGHVAVAGQGTAALLYATPNGRQAVLDVLAAMRREPWTADVMTGERLTCFGHAATDGIVAAVDMARGEAVNEYGVAGWRWTVAEPDKPAAIGSGQHGGLGPDETAPFLMLNGGGIAAGRRAAPSSLIDIAPTILGFLGLPAADLDGVPLVDFATGEAPGSRARPTYATQIST
jgi:hypothetical protein